MLPAVGTDEGYTGIRGAVRYNLATAPKTEIYRKLSNVLPRQGLEWVLRNTFYTSSLDTARCWLSLFHRMNTNKKNRGSDMSRHEQLA